MKTILKFFSLTKVVYPWRSFKRRLTGCCLLIILLGLFICIAFLGLSFYLAQLVAAQSPRQRPQEVLLLIDNSNSMFEKDGVGSDPDLLRIQAARLFITYLGVDSGGVIHRLGVIFFGGEARLVVPLTTLAGDTRRAELAQLIDNPQRMAWTNHQAALELAEELFKTSTSGATTRRAVVLLTDGKPEWTTTPTEQETVETIARLHHVAGRFAVEKIPLFIILLQNNVTDADPEIERLYVPLWQEMVEATPPGHFYHARRSDELLDIYHDIVVKLTNRQTAGVVLETQVQTHTLQPIEIEPNLQQVTFVIRKSSPTLQVQIRRPNGQPVRTTEADVQYGGQPGQSLEEIWAISLPAAGEWQIQISGQGAVTVWKDFYPAPATPTLTPSSTATFTPTPQPTPAPTSTPVPSPTFTPTPSLTPTRPSSPTALPVSSASRLASSPATNDTSKVSWLGWILLPVTLLVTGGSGWLWWHYRRKRQPLLSGVLRPVTVPALAGHTLPARLDLDALNRPEISLGSEAAAYLYLPHLSNQRTPAARLVARWHPEFQPAVTLVVSEANTAETVLVNSVPAQQERALRDGDVITLGAYRFKYENLRQRRRFSSKRPP